MITAVRAIPRASPNEVLRARRSSFGAVVQGLGVTQDTTDGGADSLQGMVSSMRFLSPTHRVSKPFSISPGARQNRCASSHARLARARSSLSAGALRRWSNVNQPVFAKRFGPIQRNAARQFGCGTLDQIARRVAPLRAGRCFRCPRVTHPIRETPTGDFLFACARQSFTVTHKDCASARDLFTHRQALRSMSTIRCALGGATFFAKLSAKRVAKPVFGLPACFAPFSGAGPRPCFSTKEKCHAPHPLNASDRRRTTCKN